MDIAVDAKLVVQTIIGIVLALIGFLLRDKLAQVEKAQAKSEEGMGKMKSEIKADIDSLRVSVNTNIESFRKELVQVDKSVLEYKASVTGKFAELSDRFVNKAENAKDSVTVQNQLRSLENAIHRKTHEE